MINRVRYVRRRLVNRVFMSLAVLAAAFGLSWLALILGELLWRGLGGINATVFTMDTPAPMMEGGLANAIYGSLVMSAIAVAVGTPVGVLAGTYLAEYGRYSPLAGTIRFFNDILLSAPSILIGLFIYQLVVVRMGNFSAIAGAMGAGAGATVGMGHEIECQYYGMCGGPSFGADVGYGAAIGAGAALIYNVFKHEKALVLLQGTHLTFVIDRSVTSRPMPESASIPATDE